MQIHNSYKIYNSMNTFDKHFQQLVLQQISELLPTKQMQIHNNYKTHSTMETSNNMMNEPYGELLTQTV